MHFVKVRGQFLPGWVGGTDSIDLVYGTPKD